MIDLPDRIITSMSSLDFIAQTYPILTEWGVRDEDVLVHSIGCSVWTALGQALGFISVSECPAPTIYGADVRPDSTWFSREQRTPSVLVEFERFDGPARSQHKLDEKICNLLDASMRWNDSPSVLVLAAWSKGVVSAPDKEALIRRCRNGFTRSTGSMVHPFRIGTILFCRFIFEVEIDGHLFLRQTKCERLM